MDGVVGNGVVETLGLRIDYRCCHRGRTFIETQGIGRLLQFATKTSQIRATQVLIIDGLRMLSSVRMESVENAGRRRDVHLIRLQQTATDT